MSEKDQRVALIAGLVAVLGVIVFVATRLAGGNEMFAVRVNGKFGFIDSGGKLTIQPQFDDAGQFAKGLAPVKVGPAWGYVDRSGKLAVPPNMSSPIHLLTASRWSG